MKNLLTLLLLCATFLSNAQEIRFTKQQDQTLNENTTKQPDGWIRVTKDEFTGYIDEAGIEIIPPIYHDIEPFGEYDFELALTVRGEFVGFIDRDGNVVTEPQYLSIEKTEKPGWFLVQKDGLFGIIDVSGEEIVKPVYSNIEIGLQLSQSTE